MMAPGTRQVLSGQGPFELVIGNAADVTLSFNGKPVQVGSTAAILGNPLRALVAGARFAEACGEPLQPGWIVMAGGATAAEALSAGVYAEMEMQSLGRVGFSVSA